MTKKRFTKKVIWKVEAQGDVVYVQAASEAEAVDVIVEKMGAEVEPFCTFKVVDALPADEELLNP